MIAVKKRRRLVFGEVDRTRIWRLQAEEYRAIAEGMKSPVTRATMTELAVSYDILATRDEKPPRRRCSSRECLAYASQCEAMADNFKGRHSETLLKGIAGQWRRLAATAQ
jgi:hypothetical protein